MTICAKLLHRSLKPLPAEPWACNRLLTRMNCLAAKSLAAELLADWSEAAIC